MKKLVFISGSLFSSITVLSTLFKLMHLTGAQELLICGLSGIAIIFIPSFAKYKYDQKK